MPPGSLCLISVCPTVERIQPCLHQAQKQGQRPEVLRHWLSPYPSLVQFSLCPRRARVAPVPGCALASAVTVPRLLLGARVERGGDALAFVRLL